MPVLILHKFLGGQKQTGEHAAYNWLLEPCDGLAPHTCALRSRN